MTYVLLEARASKANRCLQELGPNAGVHAHHASHFINVSAYTHISS